MSDKTVLTGKTKEELKTLMEAIGEQSFRADQIFKWINKKSIHDFMEMTNLSKDLRRKLQKRFDIKTLAIKDREISNIDNSKKYLFELADGHVIESVYMPHEDRTTLCISCMVGCNIGCPYCATGMMGLKRKLTAGEIVEQLLWINNEEDNPVSNVVFMGMGEPFLNYNNSIKAAQIFNTNDGPEISTRRIVISTCGITPQINKFSEEGHKFKLAISLNGTTNEQRNELIPINKKYPLEELLKASQKYAEDARDRVTFEYILIKNFNDSMQDAKRLQEMLSPIPCKLNIIPYNENEHLDYQSPSEEELEQFINELYDSPFPVMVRRSKGQDISAACGQLYINEEKNK